MPKPTPPPDQDPEIPIGRLAVWAVLAAVLAFGIYLYFRDAGSMRPLID